jgi:hypothetical protein
MNKRHGGAALALFAAGMIVLAAGCTTKKEETAEDVTAPARASDIAARLQKFAPTEIAVDPAVLSDEDRLVLNKLIEASRLIDPIFWKQAYPPGLALKDRLERSTDPADAEALRFLLINFGPFDRQDENRPFIGIEPKPLGAGFYPADLTKAEFEAYVAAHPDEKEALESPFTLVKREGGNLVAVPYAAAFKEDLEKIAVLLREAAGLTSNASFKAYLEQRAVDLLSNDYTKSDFLWIDIQGTRPEIVIGPYEVYEDALLGLKASFESFVYVNDFESMKKLEGYLAHLDEMQQALPVEPKYKSAQVKGLASPLNVVFEVFTAGDTKAGVQTSAFVLPNDEKVRAEKGTKKVFLKNMMEAKFAKSLIPIAGRVLAPEDAARVTFDAYFTEVLLHEICHVLGVNFLTLPDGTQTTVNKALKDLNTPIEEGKADVTGIASVPLLVARGLIPKEREAEIYTAYLAGMFRSMRFGVAEAHGLAVLVQWNFLREKGAFASEAASGKFRVDPARFVGGVRDLARELLVLEGDGDYAKARAFIDRYGRMDEVTKGLIDALADIPVDIAPVFRLSY